MYFKDLATNTPAASTLTGDEVLPLVQDGVTKNATIAEAAAAVSVRYDTPSQGLTLPQQQNAQWNLFGVSAGGGDNTTVAKPSGNGQAGVINWAHDDTVGYLLHLTARAGSGENASLIGLGTDYGSANGLLISHKNTGAGFRLAHNPGGSLANYWSGYSVSRLLYAAVHPGSGGLQIKAETGAGFNDGVTTSGSTAFTSETAAFVPGDVGATLVQIASRGGTDPSGSIPSGTTIAAYVSPTEVTMSQPAAYNATVVMFVVGGRAPSATQTLLRFADESDVSIGVVRKGDLVWRTPIDARTNDAALPSVKVTGHDSQTAEIFSVFKTSATTSSSFAILASGRMIGRWGQTVSNAGDTTQIPLTVQTYAAGVQPMQIIGFDGQTADQFSVKDASNVVQTRLTANGTFVTRVNTAHSDAAIQTNEMSIWFDSTAGAAKLMIKAKNASGTVVTGSVALT